MKKIMSKSLIVTAFILSSASFAADKAVRSGYENSYGMAGCGLGSILSKEMEWSNGPVQIFVATTNHTYGNQTVSMTIGISHCDDGLFTEQLKAEQEVFVGVNLASLAKDAARGGGESLEAFADLLGCAESADDLARFAALGRTRHETIFAAMSAEKVLAGYKNAVTSDGMHCLRI